MSEGNKRQVSHTYSVTVTQQIKQLAVIRVQQLGLTWQSWQQQTARADAGGNHSHTVHCTLEYTGRDVKII